MGWATFRSHAHVAAGWRPNNIQRIVLALVWIAMTSGAVVFTEPAPFDVLALGLLVLLPLAGLVAAPGALWLVLAVWLVAAAGGFVASAQSLDVDRSTIHTGISLYMYAAFFIFAAFVAKRPQAHTKLLLDGYLWAAVIAAFAGIVGYFGLAPGAAELFTKYGRATGTFKDPNVYGPFLAPAIIYVLHRILHDKPERTVVPAAILLLLSFGLLLSFSRGAWLNTAVGIAIYTYGSIVFARTEQQQARIIMLGALAVAAAAGLLAVAAQFDEVGGLLSSRAAVTQSYDEGPEGRFGGQAQAMRMILDHPLGLGALQFGMHYHHEDVHNVYLSMFFNAGWLGGLIWAAMIATTAVFGALHLLRATATRPYFLIAYGAFLGNAVEGFVVDIDHWRHLYLLLAIVWGLIAAQRVTSVAASPAAGTSIRRGRIVRGCASNKVRSYPAVAANRA